MCKRKRLPHQADLPFQKQRAFEKFEPREKWSRLRLWVWRLQMRVGRNIRRLRKWAMSKFGTYPEGQYSWMSALSSRLGSRFSVASKEYLSSESDAIAGLLEGPGPGLRSTMVRRTVQVATERVKKYLTFPKRVLSVITGGTCYVCSGPHGTHICVQMLQKELQREDEHEVIVRHRLALESDKLVIAEETQRLALIQSQRQKILRKRARGVSYVGWCIAKYGLTSIGVLAPLKALAGMATILDDAWYIATGAHFVRPTGFTQVFNKLWMSKTLLDFIEANTVARTPTVIEKKIEVQPLEVVEKVDLPVKTVEKPAPVSPLVSFVRLGDSPWHIGVTDVHLFGMVALRFHDALVSFLGDLGPRDQLRTFQTISFDPGRSQVNVYLDGKELVLEPEELGMNYPFLNIANTMAQILFTVTTPHEVVDPSKQFKDHPEPYIIYQKLLSGDGYRVRYCWLGTTGENASGYFSNRVEQAVLCPCFRR